MATSDIDGRSARFDAFLSRAWADHADHPDAVADRLRTDTPEPVLPAQVAALARLVVHLLGEHLGRFDDAHWRLSSLRGHPLASEPVAVSELRVSHAALSFACRRPGTDAALSPPERVRALGSAAAICLGRGEAAHSLKLIAAARAELGRMPGASAADHRPLAVACNNMTWELHDRGDARTPGDTDAMLEIAAACRDHWRHAGTWLEVERADYGLAMTHLSARRADDALRHAAQCLAACIAHEAAPYELFYGHEAMARVQHARGDTVACAHHRRAAQAAFDQLDAHTQGGCRGSLDRLLALAPGA